MAGNPPLSIDPRINRFKRVIWSLLMPRFLDRFIAAIGEVPGEVARWATNVDESTFLQIMLVGTVVLIIVVARALR
jgi:hypothetical protein